MLALRLRRSAGALVAIAGPSRVLCSPLLAGDAGPSRVRGEPPRRGLGSSVPLSAKKPVTRSSMTASQRKAFAKQQALARAMAEGEGAAPVPPSAPAAGGPAVQDLLAMKPDRRPRPREASYADEHAALVERLDGAFVRAQVVELARALGLAPGHREPKASVIQKILDSWGWIRPSEADTGVWTRHIPMTTAQMFLLQRDADVSAWLGRLRRVDVAVEVGATPGTYVVVARGPRRKLDALEEFLASHREAHATAEWPVGDMAGLSPSERSLWAISSATGAYVEALGWTKYRATGGSASAAERARDMLLRAARRAHAPSPPLSALVPPADGASAAYVALIPHVPAASSSLPWTTEILAADRPLFRLSRVSGFGLSPGERELQHRDAHMNATRVRPLSSTSEPGTLEDTVRGTLAGADMPGASDAAKSVTFQFGHLISPGAAARPAAEVDADTVTSAALTHPIAGAWPLDDPASMWLRLSTPIFSPAVPPGLIRYPLAGSLRRYRRVTYASDALRLVASYAYPAEAEAEAEVEPADDRPWIVALDAQLAAARKAAGAGSAALEESGAPDTAPFDFGAVQSMISDTPTPPRTHELNVTARLGKRARRDVLAPDRPIDLRVVADAARDIEPPEALEAFFSELHEHADEAGTVPLSDLETLRTGRGVAPAQAVETREDEDDSWDIDDVEEDHSQPARSERREFGLRASDDRDDIAPDIEVAAPISPPATLDVGGSKFALEADEVVEVVESSVAMAKPESSPASLRTLAVADLLGPGGVYRYAELHAPAPPDGALDAGVWREFANATRQVPPVTRATPLPF